MFEESKKTLLFILEASKNDRWFTVTDPQMISLLSDMGCIQGENSTWRVEREERIGLATKAVSSGINIEEVVNLLTWKDFEGLVAVVLEENGYNCIESFRRRGNAEIEGMEIDVIGVKGRRILSIDAKMWGVRTGKTSALKRAAEKQRERTNRLSESIESLSKKLGGLQSGVYTAYPMMTTWLVEEYVIHEGVPIIPIFKMNSFFDWFEENYDFIVSFEINAES